MSIAAMVGAFAFGIALRDVVGRVLAWRARRARPPDIFVGMDALVEVHLWGEARVTLGRARVDGHLAIVRHGAKRHDLARMDMHAVEVTGDTTVTSDAIAKPTSQLS